MPDEAGAIVPVTPENVGQVQQVQDAGNRGVRALQNIAPLTGGIYLLNKYTHVDLDVDDILLGLTIVVPLLSGARRWFEIRVNQLPRWLRWILPPPQADIAAPITADGQVLGQLKTS